MDSHFIAANRTAEHKCGHKHSSITLAARCAANDIATAAAVCGLEYAKQDVWEVCPDGSLEHRAFVTMDGAIHEDGDDE